MKSLFLRIFCVIICAFISFFINYIFLSPLFNSASIIFPYAIHPFDISKDYPDVWNFLKSLYIITYLLSNILIFNSFFSFFHKINHHTTSKNHSNNIQINNNELNLLVGTLENSEKVYITQKGLFQNVLVTGTIGSGKTSSILYPFTNQLISYNSNKNDSKISLLILDVKGNYYKMVQESAKLNNRLNDLLIIELNGFIKYNPLDKPNLKPQVLANRLKTVLTLFSSNNTESYWLDKAEQVLTECIKLCRLYNSGYVTFSELHKLVLFPNYYEEKISYLKKLFNEKKLSIDEIKTLSSCIDFFQNEFFSLDSRTLSILKSEISRITNVFVSDNDVNNTFCPDKKDNSFPGFKNILKEGKIVVLSINIAEYSSLAKIISAYMKLDFQSEVLSQLAVSSPNNIRTSCFISDEFHEFVTSTDGAFFAQSREAKCINIVATQSYTSILNTLKNEAETKVIIQNLINKFWFRTDDSFTIEEAQKQLGKIEKEKTSKTISENAKKTNFNFFLNSFMSLDSSISESLNVYNQTDFAYDFNFFTQNLETFTCLSFISDGLKILPPQKIFLKPYFTNEKLNNNFYSIMKGFDINEN